MLKHLFTCVAQALCPVVAVQAQEREYVLVAYGGERLECRRMPFNSTGMFRGYVYKYKEKGKLSVEKQVAIGKEFR